MALSEERRNEIGATAAKILLDTQSVLFNARDPFTLTSGRLSPSYVDIRRLIAFPQERDILMEMAVEMLSEEIGADNLDYIAGGETAGIPYAAFIAQLMKKPMLYVRKKPKGHGRMAQIEGHMDENTNGNRAPQAILVEDLQTDGGSKKVFVDAMRDAGATVKHGFVVFHYGILPRSKANMDALGIQLHELTNWWHVLDAAKAGDYFDSETLNVVEEFLNGPDAWQEKMAS